MRHALLCILTAVLSTTSLAGGIEKALARGNYDKALQRLRPPAAQGDADAQYKLGAMYYHGAGVKQDLRIAAEWIVKAAEQGHAEAQAAMGRFHDYGEGVEQDRDVAVDWLARAGEQGVEPAMFRLGQLRSLGYGAAPDRAAAVQWLERAADQGHAGAQYELGMIHQWGLGVEPDRKRAREWLARAAKQGNEAAANRAWPEDREGSRLEIVPCWFEVPLGRSAGCGWMTVPENRREASDRTIRFPVVLYRAYSGGTKAHPLIVLGGGGPGNPVGLSAEQATENWNHYAWAFLTEGRDVIMIDVRGVGESVPRLTCPELVDLGETYLAEVMPLDQRIERIRRAAQICHDRYVEDGVDLTAYDSAASAEDVEDLRHELGYSRWDLLGSSYGGRLALTILRDFPDGVRSAILDSPGNLGTTADHKAEAAARSFDLLFDSCAADADCSRRFPDLRGLLTRLHADLERNPVELPVTHPRSLEAFPMRVDGDRLITLLFHALYSERKIEKLPLALHAAGHGSYDLLAPLARQRLADWLDDEFSDGAGSLVWCRERWPFYDPRGARRRIEGSGILRGLNEELLAWSEAECAVWNPGSAGSIEGLPVVSDVPTLILSGRFDPTSGPLEARRIERHLSRSHHLEFPAEAHGILGSSNCARSAVIAFLERPERSPARLPCIRHLEGLQFDEDP